MLAGHALSIREDRAFLASQGASRAVYYVGGLMLLFAPGLHMTRGGAAWLLRPHFVPFSREHFLLFLGAAGSRLRRRAHAGPYSAASRFASRPARRIPAHIAAGPAGVGRASCWSWPGQSGSWSLLVATAIGLLPPPVRDAPHERPRRHPAAPGLRHVGRVARPWRSGWDCCDERHCPFRDRRGHCRLLSRSRAGRGGRATRCTSFWAASADCCPIRSTSSWAASSTATTWK